MEEWREMDLGEVSKSESDLQNFQIESDDCTTWANVIDTF